LNQHKPEPCVEIHPLDAQHYGLIANSLAKIETAWGSMLARVTISDQQQSGNLFVPMHWTAQYASQGRMGSLVNPVVDPISKQAESKHTPVRISPYIPDWYAFILSRHELNLHNIEYWVKNKADQYYRYELASTALSESWPAWINAHLPNINQTANDVLEYADSGLKQYRAAYLLDNALDTVIFIDGANTLPERAWLGSLFAKNQLDASERSALLSGKPPQGKPDCGAIICACFNVGETTIRNTIASQGLKSVQEVGRCLKAGTNCGSCLPEIKALF
jgi:assimilatory nitrate reductase catalytic subunit